MAAQQEVKFLSVAFRVKDGDSERTLLLSQGSPVPDGVSKEDLARLREDGAIGDVNAEEPASSLPLPALADLTDVELLGVWESKPTVAQLVDAVGSDPRLASRVLEAERTFTRGEPRVTLVNALEKVGDE